VIDTLARMLDGCRANLIHFTGGTQAANMAEQWQYRGFPPMTRVIEARHCRPAPRPGFSTGPQDAGGHGFLRAPMRVVNVLVKLVTNGEHAQPWFMADSQYRSHGDLTTR